MISFSSLKRFFTLRRIRRRDARRDVSKLRFYNGGEIKKLHILCAVNKRNPAQSKQYYKELSEILDDCGRRGVKARATVFVRRSTAYTNRFGIQNIARSDCRMLSYVPRRAFVDFFNREKDEVVLNLTTKTFYALEYLVAQSDAPFRVGLQRSDQGARYDFLVRVQDEDSLSELYKQVFFYLDKINSRG